MAAQLLLGPCWPWLVLHPAWEAGLCLGGLQASYSRCRRLQGWVRIADWVEEGLQGPPLGPALLSVMGQVPAWPKASWHPGDGGNDHGTGMAWCGEGSALGCAARGPALGWPSTSTLQSSPAPRLPIALPCPGLIRAGFSLDQGAHSSHCGGSGSTSTSAVQEGMAEQEIHKQVILSSALTADPLWGR